MKHFFKFCFPKVLFLLFVTSAGIRPAAIVPAAMATEELAALAVMIFAAISQVLGQYRQPNRGKDVALLVSLPETSAPIQSIPVVGKSDEEVVAKVTQAITTAIGIKHNLSRVDQNQLNSQLRSQKLRLINTIADNRSWGQVQHRLIVHRATIGSIKSSNRKKRDISKSSS